MSIISFFSCEAPVIEDLSRDKQRHAKRVTKLVRQLSTSYDVYIAAYYHDYLEDVGDETKLSTVSSSYSYKLINILTHDDDVDVLEDLRYKLQGLDQMIIDDIVIIKISDRIDNVNNRNLTKRYVKKSSDLIQYLYDIYGGDKKELKKFIKKNLKEDRVEKKIDY